MEATAAEKALLQARLEDAQAVIQAELSYWTCAKALGLPLPGTEQEEP